MDDTFVEARAAGSKSVFSGGDDNYSGLTTADFHCASAAPTDQVIVQNAIDRIKNDQARVIRIDLQRLRDDWTGPARKTDPASAYSRNIVADDALLGQLIVVLKDQGLSDGNLLVVTSDHGMGQSAQSTHLPSVRSSWDIFMSSYGPGVKKGTAIPYSELPDVAVTVAKFRGPPSLKGRTAATVTLAVKGRPAAGAAGAARVVAYG